MFFLFLINGKLSVKVLRAFKRKSIPGDIRPPIYSFLDVIKSEVKQKFPKSRTKIFFLEYK